MMEPGVFESYRTYLPEAFHERRTHEFGGEKKIIWIAVLRGWNNRIWDFLYCWITKTIPSFHPHYCCANLDKLRNPYFQKVGRYVRPNPTCIGQC